MPTRSSRSTPDTASDEVPVSLDDVAEELYGLAPEEFTAARNQHEKDARQAGDRELAASIHALPKPSITAWLANQLAREHREELQPLLELGAGLREATRTLSGDQLRDLSRQQHELVYALVQQGRQLARASGHSVSEDTARGLEDTLHAALADEAAAGQLLAGRLTEGLQRSGFGDSVPDQAEPAARKTSGPTSTPRVDEQLRRAERDVAEAQRMLTDAVQTRDEAQAQVSQADRAAEKAQQQEKELRRQLEEASTAAADAERHRRDRATALSAAERTVSDAERRQTDAAQRRDRLAGDG
jgi:hypothetical protein